MLAAGLIKDGETWVEAARKPNLDVGEGIRLGGMRRRRAVENLSMPFPLTRIVDRGAKATHGGIWS
jgi:hypothetical protein